MDNLLCTYNFTSVSDYIIKKKYFITILKLIKHIFIKFQL